MKRKIDKLGRIVIPIDFRKALGLADNDEIEMVLRPNELMIQKAQHGCIFCNAAATDVQFGDLFVCRSCIERLYSAKDNDVLYNVTVD